MKVINAGRLPEGGGGKGVGHIRSRGREFSCHRDGRGGGGRRLENSAHAVLPSEGAFSVTSFTCWGTWAGAEGGRGGPSCARPAPSAQDGAGRTSVAATAGPSPPEPETGRPGARGPGRLPGSGASGSRDPGASPATLGGSSVRTLSARHPPRCAGTGAPGAWEEQPRQRLAGLRPPAPPPAIGVARHPRPPVSRSKWEKPRRGLEGKDADGGF